MFDFFLVWSFDKNLFFGHLITKGWIIYKLVQPIINIEGAADVNKKKIFLFLLLLKKERRCFGTNSIVNKMKEQAQQGASFFKPKIHSTKKWQCAPWKSLWPKKIKKTLKSKILSEQRFNHCFLGFETKEKFVGYFLKVDLITIRK